MAFEGENSARLQPCISESILLSFGHKLTLPDQIFIGVCMLHGDVRYNFLFLTQLIRIQVLFTPMVDMDRFLATLLLITLSGTKLKAAVPFNRG